MELTGAGATIVMQNLDSRYNQLVFRSYSLVKLQQVGCLFTEQLFYLRRGHSGLSP